MLIQSYPNYCNLKINDRYKIDSCHLQTSSRYIWNVSMCRYRYFYQNVSVPIQIQHYKMYLCADTDTFPDTFWLIIDQNIVNFKFFVKYNGILSGLSIINIFLVKVTTFWLKNVGKIANFGSKGIVKSIGSLKCINTSIHF